MRDAEKATVMVAAERRLRETIARAVAQYVYTRALPDGDRQLQPRNHPFHGRYWDIGDSVVEEISTDLMHAVERYDNR